MRFPRSAFDESPVGGTARLELTQVLRLPHRRAIAVFAVLLVALPWLLPSNYYLNVLVFAGINVLLALGLNLVMGYTGQVSLGHAGFYGLGAYASGVLTTKYGFNPWAALLTAMLLTAVVSAFIGVITLRLQGYFLSMATLGFGIILHILFVELAGLTGGPSGLTGIPSLGIGTFVLRGDLMYYYFTWGLVCLVLLGAVHLVDSRFGRALRAIQGDEIAASLAGIDTLGAKVQVFVVAACLASVAGSIYAHYVSVLSPDSFGFMFSIELVVMVVIGGAGSIWGGMIGALILTVLPEFLRSLRDYDVLAFGLIVVLIVMFLPRGLAGSLEHGLLQRRVQRVSR